MALLVFIAFYSSCVATLTSLARVVGPRMAVYGLLTQLVLAFAFSYATFALFSLLDRCGVYNGIIKLLCAPAAWTGMSSDRLSRLIEWFGPFGSAIVAFSGGVDSSLVAYAAHLALESRSLAVTFDSPLLPPGEVDGAISLAKALGMGHEVIRSAVPEEVLANDRLRCYYCKRGEMGFLVRLARERGFQVVVDGTNADDLRGGWRPGIRALSELGVRSPLAELGMTKEEVRAAAREAGLPNFDKPSMACLASRFPYGHRITVEELMKVGAAETFIRQLGFRMVRVRDFGGVARIEVGRDEIPMLFEGDKPERIHARLKELGFQYVDVDIRGYRTGSMDEPYAERGRQEESRARGYPLGDADLPQLVIFVIRKTGGHEVIPAARG